MEPQLVLSENCNAVSQWDTA